MAGAAFEHFHFLELTAYKGLKEKDIAIRYWRTKTGLEVDFILGEGDLAIDVKINQHVEARDLSGLFAFAEEHKPRRALVVSQDKKKRVLTKEDLTIEIYPWQEFLVALWRGEFI